MALGSTIKGEGQMVKGHEKYVRGTYEAGGSFLGTIETSLLQTRHFTMQSCGTTTGETIPKPVEHEFPLDTGSIDVAVGDTDKGIWEAWGT